MSNIETKRSVLFFCLHGAVISITQKQGRDVLDLFREFRRPKAYPFVLEHDEQAVADAIENLLLQRR